MVSHQSTGITIPPQSQQSILKRMYPTQSIFERMKSSFAGSNEVKFTVQFVDAPRIVLTTMTIFVDRIECPQTPTIKFKELFGIRINHFAKKKYKKRAFGLQLTTSNTFQFLMFDREERNQILNEILSRFPTTDINQTHLETIKSARAAQVLVLEHEGSESNDKTSKSSKSVKFEQKVSTQNRQSNDTNISNVISDAMMSQRNASSTEYTEREKRLMKKFETIQRIGQNWIEERAVLRKRIESLHALIVRLKSDLEREQNERASDGEMIRKLEAEAKDTESVRKSFQEAEQQMLSKFDKLKMIEGKWIDERERLSTANLELESRISRLSGQINIDQMTWVESDQGSVGELEIKYNALKADEQNWIEDRAKLRNEVRFLKDRVIQLTKELDQKQARKCEMPPQSDSLKMECMESELHALKARIRSMKSYQSNLKEKNEILRTNEQQLKDRLLTLEAEKKSLRAEVAHRRGAQHEQQPDSEQKDLQKQILRLKKRNKNLMVQVEHGKKQSKRQQSELEGETQNLRERISKLEGENEKLAKEVKKGKRGHGKLNAELEKVLKNAVGSFSDIEKALLGKAFWV